MLAVQGTQGCDDQVDGLVQEEGAECHRLAMQDKRVQQAVCAGGRLKAPSTHYQTPFHAWIVRYRGFYPYLLLIIRSQCPQCDATFTRVSLARATAEDL